jgi:hypothetical protein
MELNLIRYMAAKQTQTAVQYLKKMVFPYLTHEEKMLTGQFFYEAELMEKEHLMMAFNDGRVNAGLKLNRTSEQYYNETYNQ